MTKATTLAQVWLGMRERPASHAAVKVRRAEGWTDLTWAEYSRDIELIAAGLVEAGVKPGDRVAIMSNTRYEWACSDFAIMAIGAVTVCVYPNNTPEDTSYMINDSGASVFLGEGPAILKVWDRIRAQCPQVHSTFVFDGGDDQSKPLTLLKDAGRKRLEAEPDCVTRVAAKIKATDLATLLYTSGTTGQPKGVMIGHEQAVSEVSEAFPLCGVNESDVSLTFLPYSHIFGRIEMWGHAYIGFTMAFAESIEKIRANLSVIRPTIFVAVPRIFEKVHGGIYAQMENQLIKRKLFDWAVDIGAQVSDLRVTREMIPLPLLAQYEAARRLVLNKIQEAFGGRLRFAVSGGAPLHADIARFFHGAGILILQGYGLTETTAALTVNTPFNYRFDAVGRAIGDVELKIAPDGEILARSKKIMQGYYKNPRATNEAIVDGWFHTGDIGEILAGGDLKITDRKKDLIKTAGGKYVAPQKLESLLQIHPLIEYALIHGDQKKFVVTLLSPNRANVQAYAKEHGLSGSWPQLLENPELQAQFRQAVADANAQLASWESIKRFRVLPVEFSVEGGELTPSLKVKRKALDERYRKEIEALYG